MDEAQVRVTMGCLDDASCPLHRKSLELRDWQLNDPAKLDEPGFRQVRATITQLLRGLRTELVLSDRGEGRARWRLLLPPVAVSTCLIGPWTGSPLNPARTIAPAVLSGAYTDLWIFLTAVPSRRCSGRASGDREPPTGSTAVRVALVHRPGPTDASSLRSPGPPVKKGLYTPRYKNR